MKRYKNKIGIGILVAAFVLTSLGCAKFLDADPYSFTSTENFYQTPEEAEMALVGCYNSLNSRNRLFGRDLPFILNGGTDECITREGISNDHTPFGLAAISSSTTKLKSVWEAFYEGINRTNHLIAKIEGVEMNETRKTQITAEARFLRGFYHMYLTMMFGAIPVKTTPDPEAGPRQQVEEVYAQIIADLQFAYENLPPRAKIQGAANKWSAAGYLAKVYAYMGSAKESGMGNDLNFALNSFDWVDADEAYDHVFTITTDIVQNGGYKLTDRYDFLFRETTRDAQYEECLFTVEASSSPSNGIYNRYSDWVAFGSPSLGGGNSRWFVPLAEAFDRYNISGNDVRRAHNMVRNITANSSVEEIGGYRYYNPTVATSPENGFFSAGKYRQRDAAQKPIPDYASDGLIPLLRYADILLLQAEALYHDGDEPGARDLLTEVRERAVKSGSTVTELNTSYHRVDFIQELVDERSRELCFETHRRFDLARFNKYTAAIEGLKSTRGLHNVAVPDLQANWKPYRIWFPIPLAELDLNPQLKPQNPGYGAE
ncbi:RagB/SusD family nutrient uptake outer membrane protein [Sphingobacterium sp. SGG-5]|uniref:RagB/SusD family nutrient uptake outer membrane protein n=1 Tax=Sphingobacterium sp. SGG-5 TaxID=2710881 RepID=UPI0013EBEEB7|nr:RagB/SusD family nutrient uptake outer membrane protein [Sphingobacterium sp. SGG-5]NGM63481.1 RagB/SusD family nutrient uptake outer membrane protein [Sphingobacterium sp. SGG-5]